MGGCFVRLGCASVAPVLVDVAACPLMPKCSPPRRSRPFSSSRAFPLASSRWSRCSTPALSFAIVSACISALFATGICLPTARPCYLTSSSSSGSEWMALWPDFRRCSRGTHSHCGRSSGPSVPSLDLRVRNGLNLAVRKRTGPFRRERAERRSILPVVGSGKTMALQMLLG
jgi:hypothetical protein